MTGMAPDLHEEKVMFKSAIPPVCIAGALLLVPPAARAETVEQTMQFAGNEIEVVQTDDYDRVLRINGEEVFRDFQIFIERSVPLGGREVVLASAGPGGNACGSYPLILIPANDGTLTMATPLGTGCGLFAEVAATADRLVFMGYPQPGIPASIDQWQPRGGLEHVGRIEFEPAPETGWSTLDPAAVSHPIDLFSNGDVYRAIAALAGGDLGALAASLRVSGSPELVDGRFMVATGCTPHACGTADGFLAVDIEDRAVYAATDATDTPAVWPAAGDWPQPLRARLEAWQNGQR
jgi:hypothetical protein